MDGDGGIERAGRRRFFPHRQLEVSMDARRLVAPVVGRIQDRILDSATAARGMRERRSMLFLCAREDRLCVSRGDGRLCAQLE